MKFVALFLCFAFCILPALGDDFIAMPDGQQIRLEPILLESQFRGADAVTEDIFVLTLYEGDAPFQELYFTTMESREYGPLIKAHDLNFDGWPDLDIIYLLGASNSQHIFFFYEPDIGLFRSWEYGYHWLSNFEADPETNLIINYIHDSAITGTKEIYRWEGKQLKLVRRGEIAWDENNPDALVLRIAAPDPQEGELKTIHTGALDLGTASENDLLSFHQERDKRLWEGLK